MSNSAVKVETACERYLDWIADAKRSMSRLNADRDEMRSVMDGLKAVRYDREGGGSTMLHGDDAMAASIERLEEIDRRVADKARHYAEAVEDWLSIRVKLPSVEADALQLHYIDGQPWDVVASAINYSERNVYRVRIDALFDLYELLPPGWQ